MNYLDEIEKEKVVAFCTDRKMFEAVRKVLLAPVLHSGVLKKGEVLPEENWAYSIVKLGKTNEQVGEEVRAVAQGLVFINEGFEKLQEMVPLDKEPVEEGNPAL